MPVKRKWMARSFTGRVVHQWPPVFCPFGSAEVFWASLRSCKVPASSPLHHWPSSVPVEHSPPGVYLTRAQSVAQQDAGTARRIHFGPCILPPGDAISINKKGVQGTVQSTEEWSQFRTDSRGSTNMSGTRSSDTESTDGFGARRAESAPAESPFKPYDQWINRSKGLMRRVLHAGVHCHLQYV